MEGRKGLMFIFVQSMSSSWNIVFKTMKIGKPIYSAEIPVPGMVLTPTFPIPLAQKNPKLDQGRKLLG